MVSLLEKYNKRYEERSEKRDEFGAAYLKGHITAIEDTAVEIAALVEEAHSDFEMSQLVHVYDRDKMEIDRNGYNAYVKALKDLADRLGIDVDVR